jgi:hypothetical protein
LTALIALPISVAAQVPDIDFALVWDSDAALTDVFNVEAGDADRDNVFDFAGASTSPNVIHLFEADSLGGYSEVWNSAAAVAPGAYADFVFADTDRDGLGEILGAETSVQGKVMLFEQSAGGGFDFVHDLIRESDPSGSRRLRSVLVGDTDLDGSREVIVIAGGDHPPAGLVSIWEHSGAIGENVYARVFDYTTSSYIFSGTIGDSDNDGLPEIVLGFDGFGGFPLNIRRLEYHPGLGTWVHLQFTSNLIGLPVVPHVADLDLDGQQELAFGSSGYAVIFENTGANNYVSRFTTAEPLPGKVISLASRTLSVPGTPTLAAGTNEGDLGLWSYDPSQAGFNRTYAQTGLGGPIGGLALADDGNDESEELVTAVGDIDEIRIYRRVILLAAPPLETSEVLLSPLSAAPNPLAGWTRLTARGPVTSLAIYDLSGRMVRRLDVSGGSAFWDARDEGGRSVPQGVYWVLGSRTGDGAKGAANRGLRISVVR